MPRGTSGPGSEGRLADFKAEVLNDLVRREGLQSVIEFGCGDGQQLARYAFPEYLGLDVSPQAVEACRARFAGDPTKQFALVQDYDGMPADLALSIDVLYHLVEQDVFEAHLRQLFSAATRFVVIYASNFEAPQDPQTPHVRRRAVTPWVEAHIAGWTLHEHIPNRYPFAGDPREGSRSDFFVYAKEG